MGVPCCGISVHYLCIVKLKKLKKMKTMQSVNSLSKSDEIIASIEFNGHRLASLSRRDFSSVDEVVRALVTMAGNFMGLARINIRNKTCGWNLMMGVASRRRPQLAPSPVKKLGNATGQQLTIPWSVY